MIFNHSWTLIHSNVGFNGDSGEAFVISVHSSVFSVTKQQQSSFRAFRVFRG
jgi:hypothetical protein